MKKATFINVVQAVIYSLIHFSCLYYVIMTTPPSTPLALQQYKICVFGYSCCVSFTILVSLIQIILNNEKNNSD